MKCKDRSSSVILVVAWCIMWASSMRALVRADCMSANCHSGCIEWKNWCVQFSPTRIIAWKYASNIAQSYCTDGQVGGTPALLDTISRDVYNDCLFDCPGDAATTTTGAPMGTKTGTNSGQFKTKCNQS
jgi:hypothetical protein